MGAKVFIFHLLLCSGFSCRQLGLLIQHSHRWFAHEPFDTFDLKAQETNWDTMLSFIHACIQGIFIKCWMEITLPNKGLDLSLALLFSHCGASLCLSFFACKTAMIIKLTSRVILDMKRWVKCRPQGGGGDGNPMVTSGSNPDLTDKLLNICPTRTNTWKK